MEDIKVKKIEISSSYNDEIISHQQLDSKPSRKHRTVDMIKIKEGLAKAYANAGHNAYFSNGFIAGVEFALSVEES